MPDRQVTSVVKEVLFVPVGKSFFQTKMTCMVTSGLPVRLSLGPPFMSNIPISYGSDREKKVSSQETCITSIPL